MSQVLQFTVITRSCLKHLGRFYFFRSIVGFLFRVSIPNDIVNGFLSVFHFWALIRAAKTPQTHHFVRFCGVFWAAQNHAINGAANGAAKSKF